MGVGFRVYRGWGGGGRKLCVCVIGDIYMGGGREKEREKVVCVRERERKRER